LGFVLVAHLIVQPYWDKKEGKDEQALELLKDFEDGGDKPPLIYAILPVLPLVLILSCSPLVVNYFHFPWKIKMNIANAMFMCTFLALMFEFVRQRSMQKALNGFKEYFNAMGKIFSLVVCLIVAGEVFAKGLMMTGALDTLVSSAQSAGLGAKSLTSACSLITMVSATMMGSGNAAFFSFAAMVPKIATALNIDPVVMTVALDEYASFGRTISPIFGAIIAVSGMAGVSPFAAAKRTLIPTLVAAAVALPFIFFYFNL
jgi:DcuC family C4-dicarboxylate transporter